MLYRIWRQNMTWPLIGLQSLWTALPYWNLLESAWQFMGQWLWAKMLSWITCLAANLQSIVFRYLNFYYQKYLFDKHLIITPSYRSTSPLNSYMVFPIAYITSPLEYWTNISSLPCQNWIVDLYLKPTLLTVFLISVNVRDYHSASQVKKRGSSLMSTFLSFITSSLGAHSDDSILWT